MLLQLAITSLNAPEYAYIFDSLGLRGLMQWLPVWDSSFRRRVGKLLQIDPIGVVFLSSYQAAVA